MFSEDCEKKQQQKNIILRLEKADILAAGEAIRAMFWATPGFKKSKLPTEF